MFAGILALDRDRNDLMLVASTGDDYTLHCGEPLEVFVSGQWELTRAELDADDAWYLVGVSGCLGLTARV